MRKKIALMMTLCLTLVMLMGMTVMASSNTCYFDFEAQNFEMKQGEVRNFWMKAYGNYRWFIKEQTSDDTYLECTCRAGTDEIVIHIGADEQADVVYFVFYPVENDTNWDQFQVSVQKSAAGLTAAPASVDVPLGSGQTGKLVSDMHSKVALLQNEAGLPLAAFAVVNPVNNVQEVFTLQDSLVMSNGRTFLHIKTLHDAARVLQISPKDKERMIAAGVDGVYINSTPVYWP